jgi:hypothetical protein
METMTELVIHLEGGDGEVVWWAESPQIPGFSAAAPTLKELRERAYRALREIAGPGPIVERLSAADSGSTVGADVDTPGGEHSDVRTVSKLVAC